MTVQLVGGDDFVHGFVIEDSDGEILDLSGYAVSGNVFWRGRVRVLLANGVEIDVQTLYPELAPDPEVQEPHGYIVLTEEQTATIPFGAIASIGLTVNRGGLTLSTFDVYLDRVSNAASQTEFTALSFFRLVHGVPEDFVSVFIPSLNFSDRRNGQFAPLI